MMKLENIQEAVKPHFIWDKSQGRRFHTHYILEGSPEIGMIVFIGIAHNWGLRKCEIMEFLEIESDEFDKKLKKFETNMKEAHDRKELGSLNEKTDMVYKTFIKSQLVIKYIRLNFKEKEYFELIEIGH